MYVDTDKPEVLILLCGQENGETWMCAAGELVGTIVTQDSQLEQQESLHNNLQLSKESIIFLVFWHSCI